MTDKDDIFHDVIMSEERSQEEGYETGRRDGRKSGIQEGYRLGWEKGSSIGSEVGFYSGFSKSLLEELQSEVDTSSCKRVIKTLQRIETLCQHFPLTDPLSLDLQTNLEEIRAKFKQAMQEVQDGLDMLPKENGVELQTKPSSHVAN